ncbi:hypothetical protein BO443_90235 [Burkholderia orbicola]
MMQRTFIERQTAFNPERLVNLIITAITSRNQAIMRAHRNSMEDTLLQPHFPMHGE